MPDLPPPIHTGVAAYTDFLRALDLADLRDLADELGELAADGGSGAEIAYAQATLADVIVRERTARLLVRDLFTAALPGVDGGRAAEAAGLLMRARVQLDSETPVEEILREAASLGGWKP